MASSVTQEQICTDSQCLAELSTMFPNIDYNVLVSVLQAHNGRMDTTVEYFMVTSNTNYVTKDFSSTRIDFTENPSQDMVGQFSEDIGGLPEMLPSFIYDTQDTLYTSDEDSSFTRSRSPSPDSDVNSEDDPLPTYEEACTDHDRLPEAVYIEDEGEGGEYGESRVEETVARETTTQVTGVQSKKYKKVGKLAGKLKSKRFKVKLAKGKKKSEHSISARQGYAPLGSDQELPDAELEGDST